MSASTIAGLIQAAALLVTEIRRLLSQSAPDLDVDETKKQLRGLEDSLADLKRARARLGETIGRGNH